MKKPTAGWAVLNADGSIHKTPMDTHKTFSVFTSRKTAHEFALLGDGERVARVEIHELPAPPTATKARKRRG